MTKIATGLVFLALVFGTFAATTTSLEGTTVFDTSVADGDDADKTFDPDYTILGTGDAATTQYVYGVATDGASLMTKAITVATDTLALTEGEYTTYDTAAPTFAFDQAVVSSRVLTADGWWVLITLEYDSTDADTYAIQSYYWQGSETTTAAVANLGLLDATLAVGADETAGAGLAVGNTWYAESTFWVTAVIQAKSDAATPVWTDTGVTVVGLSVASTPAAATGTYEVTLGTAVTSAQATNTIEAMGGCAQADDCATINVAWTDGTDFYIQPLVDDGTTGTSVTLTLPTDAEGVTSTYQVAGVVGLATTSLTLLSRAAAGTDSTTYTLVAYEDVAASAYEIELGVEATGHAMVYWQGLVGTATPFVVSYTNAAGTAYDYILAESAATEAPTASNFATDFDYAPSIFVDAGNKLWCAWNAAASGEVTTIMVAPLASNILMSAIAFVSMIVMTLFMF